MNQLFEVKFFAYQIVNIVITPSLHSSRFSLVCFNLDGNNETSTRYFIRNRRAGPKVWSLWQTA